MEFGAISGDIWNSVLAHLIYSFRTFLFIEQLAKEDYLELKQEASELHEYSNVKLDRGTRYLDVLTKKTRKLGKTMSAAAYIFSLLGSLFVDFKSRK